MDLERTKILSVEHKSLEVLEFFRDYLCLVEF